MDSNINVLVNAKDSYTNQLKAILTPPLYENLVKMFENAKNDGRSNNTLRNFQYLLRDIKLWNQDVIDEETDRIMSSTKCDYIDYLLKAVFITNTKILTSVNIYNENNDKQIEVSIPNLAHFVHKCYQECAKKIYLNPSLFDDSLSAKERQSNLRDTIPIINSCVDEAIRELLPMKQLLLQYLDNDIKTIQDKKDEKQAEDEDRRAGGEGSVSDHRMEATTEREPCAEDEEQVADEAEDEIDDNETQEAEKAKHLPSGLLEEEDGERAKHEDTIPDEDLGPDVQEAGANPSKGKNTLKEKYEQNDKLYDQIMNENTEVATDDEELPVEEHVDQEESNERDEPTEEDLPVEEDDEPVGEEEPCEEPQLKNISLDIAKKKSTSDMEVVVSKVNEEQHDEDKEMLEKQQQHNEELDQEDKKEMEKKALEDQQFEMIKERMDEEDRASVTVEDVSPEELESEVTVEMEPEQVEENTSEEPQTIVEMEPEREEVTPEESDHEPEKEEVTPDRREERERLPDGVGASGELATTEREPYEVVNKINDLRKDLSSGLDYEQLVRKRASDKMQRRNKLRTMRVRKGEMDNLMKYY
jgi:hypothetical protein